MTTKLAANWPYKPGLEYTPPARGTWTIAHTPLLVPESVEVYVCPESCLRGVSLSAAKMRLARGREALREYYERSGDNV